MVDADFFDKLSKKLTKALPEGVVHACKDVEKNFRTILQSAFAKLDLVTREEFDAQMAVLERTRKKVDDLEKSLGMSSKAQAKTERKKKT